MAKVDPWNVEGNVNYDQLVREFGVKKINPSLKKKLEDVCKKKGVDLHYLLRRDILFAHRDLDKLLVDLEKGKEFFLYTGRSPSGQIHLGHMFIWYFTKWLQDLFDVELYFQFPDEEKFLFKKDYTYEDVQKNLEDNMKDVAAIGFNPEKTFFIVNTKHANLLYPEAIKVAKKITFSNVKSSFGLTESSNIGSIFYTSMQAVPAFLPSVLKNKKLNCLIPHAVDQDPHFRITRDVIEKVGYPKPASIQSRFLPGLGGFEEDSKMSSSKESSSIYMSDSPKDIKRKINKYAFSGGRDTLEEHRKYGGNPDIDVCYNWLLFFEEDDEYLEKIYKDYKSGKLLSGELKKILIDKLTEIVVDHQEKRKEVNVDDYLKKL